MIRIKFENDVDHDWWYHTIDYVPVIGEIIFVEWKRFIVTRIEHDCNATKYPVTVWIAPE